MTPETRFVDLHSHLHDSAFDVDRKEVLSRMRKAGVATITIGTDLGESEKAVRLAEAEPDVWASVGVHPVDNRNEEWNEERFRALASHPRVVAIGECGLDYFRLEESRREGRIASVESEKDRQRELFERQIGIAKDLGKPLMIHGRPSRGTMDTYEDMLRILRAGDARGNIHFFVGDVGIARRFLDLGFTFSMTGVLTFAREYDEVVRFLPLERLHAETDSPYVAPSPYRGKRNEPTYVREVYAAIARIRGEDPETVRARLVQNSMAYVQISNSLGFSSR